MKKVYILGAGGFGREVWQWAKDHPDCDSKWKLEGFLDDADCADRGLPGPCIGPTSSIQPDVNTLILNGLAVINVKQQLVSRLLERGFEFLTLIHPTCLVNAKAQIGRGSILCPFCIVTDNVEVGEFAVFNCRTGMGHDVRVGSWTTTGPCVQISGNADIGKNVFIGGSAFLLPNVRIGDHSKVAAGSIVFTHVKSGTTVAGNPAAVVSC